MSKSIFTYGPLSLGSFSTAGASTEWFALPQPMDSFGLVLDVSSSTIGGHLEGTISTASTEVVTLATSTGPIVFSTGGTPVAQVRFNSTGASTEAITPYFVATV